MESIYKQRVELNNWEISGIEDYLIRVFNLENEFIYSDKTMHLDIENNRFGVYKISNGEDLYITVFNDGKENENFRLIKYSDSFEKINESFEFIENVDNIFNL